MWSLSVENARGRVSREELFWFRSEKICDASTKVFGGVRTLLSVLQVWYSRENTSWARYWCERSCKRKSLEYLRFLWWEIWLKNTRSNFRATGTVLYTQGIGKGTRVESTHSKVELWGVICWVSTAVQVQVSRLSWLDRRLIESRVDSGWKLICSGFLQEISVVFFDSDLRCFLRWIKWVYREIRLQGHNDLFGQRLRRDSLHRKSS